jgi:hypothetical protein
MAKNESAVGFLARACSWHIQVLHPAHNLCLWELRVSQGREMSRAILQVAKNLSLDNS